MTEAYKAKGGYNDAALTEEDRARIRKLSEVYEKASAAGDGKTAELAHKTAEEIRAGYGYSGGEDGSEFIVQTTQKAQSAGNVADYLTALYGAKTKSRISELEQAYSESRAQNKAAAETVKPNYDALRNRASAENEIEKRNFAERAAASGLSSGTHMQAELSRSVAYQSALAGISDAEEGELKALRAQAEKLGSDYRSAVAGAVSEGEYELANALYEEALSAAKAEREDAAAAEKARESELERQYDIAELAAKYGDLSLLRALGINAKEEEAPAKSAASPAKSSASSGAGAKESGSAASTAEELFELMYENEPNEYLYLSMNRGLWDIPANSVDDVWAEYHEWRNKRLAAAGAVLGAGMAAANAAGR